MNAAIYHIIVLIVATVAIFRGFKLGFTGQVSGVLGFAFGAVCCHVFAPEVSAFMERLFPQITTATGAVYIYSVMTATVIYASVYAVFYLLTGVLRSAMQVFSVILIDRLCGVAFCMVDYLLMLSLAYNLIVCMAPSSPIMKYANADDGNIVEGVMSLAPELLGCCSYTDLAHFIQLRDAKRISRNYPSLRYVIINNTQKEDAES